MRPESHRIRYLRWFAVSAAVGVVFVLAYAAMRLGSQAETTRQVSLAPSPTLPAVEWTPISPFAQVDPAIIPYLQYGQLSEGIVPLQVLGDDIVPVGAYLPQSGNTQFAVATATAVPSPTATPLPTTTLIPVFQPSQTPLPTVTAFALEIKPLPTATLSASQLTFVTVNAPTAAVIVPTAPFYTVVPGTECAPSGLPIAGLLTQRYFIGHTGIDLSAPTGTRVMATHSGYVEWAEWNIYGLGNLVVVHSGHYVTYYAHNSAFLVKKGDFVNKGQAIALSGNTGNSSGPHVHYETRINDVTVDPLTFEKRGFRSC